MAKMEIIRLSVGVSIDFVRFLQKYRQNILFSELENNLPVLFFIFADKQ
jgi:hypothetical protein